MDKVIGSLLPATLSGFATGFLAWAGSVVFFRKRIPCATVRLRGHWKRSADRDQLYVMVVVTNIGLRKLVSTSCQLIARRCTGTVVGSPDECDVQPVPPACGQLSFAGRGIWKPPEKDRERIWTLDKDESNTYAFIVSVPRVDGSYGCYVQADFTCEPWCEKIPVIGFHSYTWRRDALYDIDRDSGPSTAHHEDAADHRNQDTEEL